MRGRSLKRSLFALLLGGWLLTTPNCLPSRSQLNAALNSGITNGVSLAITLVEVALLQGITDAVGGGTNTGA